MHRDESFMKEAIRLARLAVEHGNEPFGAVLVKDGEIVFRNENQIYTQHDPTFHAEAGLLRRFCGETGITDLSDYTLYSSCEPCFMCCGAMVWTKLGRLVYGASDLDLCGLWAYRAPRAVNWCLATWAIPFGWQAACCGRRAWSCCGIISQSIQRAEVSQRAPP